MAKGRPSKTKGPNKLVSLLMLVVLIAVVNHQWDRLVPFVRNLIGMYGDDQGVLDSEWRRISATGKTAVARFWVKNGRPPVNNLEAGLEDPGSYHSGALRSMEIVGGGRIVFEFGQSESGPPGRVRLIPDASQVLQDILKWNCETPSYKDLPSCTYVAND
jgi:hypothetical protein